MRMTIALTLGLVLWFCGCRKTPEPTPEPKPQERPKIQSFSATAEQTYRLQDDRIRRGEKILADMRQVPHLLKSRSNATTRLRIGVTSEQTVTTPSLTLRATEDHRCAATRNRAYTTFGCEYEGHRTHLLSIRTPRALSGLPGPRTRPRTRRASALLCAA